MKTIRLGIVGGNRGKIYRNVEGILPQVSIVAVCDRSDAVLKEWQESSS